MVPSVATDWAVTSLLFTIPLIHLVASPYTKVEESFNLQAVHDILVYGTPLPLAGNNPGARLSATYDHFVFPGAVPRTWIGAVLLAGLGQPLVAVAGFRHAQLVVRGLLLAFNAACLVAMRRALRRAFGESTARWWVVFMVGQFHVGYYLSRTLPNMYAFGLATLATAFLLPYPARPKMALVRQKQAIALLVISAAIFRSEVAILLVTTALGLLVSRRMSLRDLIVAFLVSFAACLAISIPVDSYFWQKPLWPELWGFYFNAILGSSSDWGVSPWHYYFTSALPRLLLNPLVPLLMLSALVNPATARSARALVGPSLAYVAIYSIQPHKEARFIFYAVPSLTAAAAMAASYVSDRWAKSAFYKVGSLSIAVSAILTFVASMGMLLLSSLNYPGGDALSQLNAIVSSDPAASSPVLVHADVLTCMTGLTLFGQNPLGLPLALGIPAPSSDLEAPVLLFDKTETLPELASPAFWKRFDYILVEDPTKTLADWEVVGVVDGYDGIEMLKPESAVDEYASAEEARVLERTLGKGSVVKATRDLVRQFTGGWWVGPRMSPRIRIMKQIKEPVH